MANISKENITKQETQAFPPEDQLTAGFLQHSVKLFMYLFHV